MESSSNKRKKAWTWIPSLYFAEGIPYVVVMLVSVIMYKRLGISNTEIALYTSWLYLPWVIKPLWSPFVDLLKTKRWWILSMQLMIGAGLGGIALMIPAPDFFKFTLIFMWLLAFSSATHDIAADGFYMLALNENDQAWFVGIRSTFYRLAMITGQGLLIILAGYVEASTGLKPIQFSINSSTEWQSALPMHPDSLVYPKSNDQFFHVIFSDGLSINGISSKKADSLKQAANQWNRSNGFIPDDVPVLRNAQGEVSKNIWTDYVSEPIENVIRHLFGADPKVVDNSKTGSIGYVYYKLKQKPAEGESIVLNVGRVSGDVSIQLIDGTRFEFNAQNWDKPAISTIQLDSKLDFVTRVTFKGTSGNISLAWSVTFFILCGLFIAFFVYHKFALPQPANDNSIGNSNTIILDFSKTFAGFFKKEKMGIAIAFLLLYRLGESQLVKLASPFLLDSREVGGLALTTGQVGFVYGTIGVLFLTLGGVTGGILAARDGLKKWIWPMLFAINVPNMVYIYLASTTPDSFLIINICVAIEQFGYGFGFTAYLLYMIFISQGEHKTAHYAICTGFMALGMMIPGMISGWIQSIIGYENFFIWVIIATIPSFIVTKFLPIDSEFGKKKKEA